METDNFSFRIVNQEKATTRRGIISVVSSMYDPLGLVTLVTLPTKSLLQSLCNRKYGWDEEISYADSVIWRGWLRKLDSLRTLSVPRRLSQQDSVQSPKFSYTISRMQQNMVTEGCRNCELSTTKALHTVSLFLANLAWPP